MVLRFVHSIRNRKPDSVLLLGVDVDVDVDIVDLAQDLITDCSFVASLCIASAFERRFHKQLITGIIYPQVPQPL